MWLAYDMTSLLFTVIPASLALTNKQGPRDKATAALRYYGWPS